MQYHSLDSISSNPSLLKEINSLTKITNVTLVPSYEYLSNYKIPPRFVLNRKKDSHSIAKYKSLLKMHLTGLGESEKKPVIRLNNFIANQDIDPFGMIEKSQPLPPGLNKKFIFEHHRDHPYYQKEEIVKLFQDLRLRAKTLLLRNNKLRSKLSEIKKEKVFLENLMTETNLVFNQKHKSVNEIHETFYMNCLNLELRKLKNEFEFQESKLNSLKKSQKIMKIQELDIQIKEAIEECQRLKEIYAQYNDVGDEDERNIKFNDEFFEEKDLEFLKQGTIRLKKNTSFLEEAKKNYEIVNFDKIDKDIKKIKVEKKELKINMVQIKKDIKNNIQKVDDLKKEIEAFIIKFQIPSRELMKAEKLLNTEQHFKKLIGEKDQLINSQVKIIAEYNTKIENKGNFQNEKKQLVDTKNKLAEEYNYLEDNYKYLCKLYGLEENKKTQEKKKNEELEAKEEENLEGNELFYKKKENANNFVKTVKYSDVSTYGYELSLKFRIKSLEYISIEKILFSEKKLKKKKNFSIKELYFELKNDPFDIKDDSKRLLIARFLIEDNEAEFIEFDYDRICQSTKIKTKFRKLIGNYTLNSKEYEEGLQAELQKTLSKNEEALKQYFSSISECKNTNFIEFITLKNAFRYLNIEIDDGCLEFILIKLFPYTEDINKLEFNKIFESFPKLKNAIIDENSEKKRASIVDFKRKIMILEKSAVIMNDLLEGKRKENLPNNYNLTSSSSNSSSSEN